MLKGDTDLGWGCADGTKPSQWPIVIGMWQNPWSGRAVMVPGPGLETRAAPELDSWEESAGSGPMSVGATHTSCTHGVARISGPPEWWHQNPYCIDEISRKGDWLGWICIVTDRAGMSFLSWVSSRLVRRGGLCVQLRMQITITWRRLSAECQIPRCHTENLKPSMDK